MTDTSDEPATPKEPNAYTGDDDDRTSSVAPRRVAFLHQFSSGNPFISSILYSMHFG